MKRILLSLCLFVSLLAAAQDTTIHQRIIHPPVRIVIDIPDLKINETVLKRKATFFTMTYNQKAESLALNWTVQFYADSSGTYGRYLGGEGGSIPDKSKEIIADNSTFVDPATGAIVYSNAAGLYNIDYMGQYDWFNMIAENQPIKVHDMMREYGEKIANWDK